MLQALWQFILGLGRELGALLGGIPAWFGDFFATIPAALRALYNFGDPSGIGQGWWVLAIALIWGVLLTAVPLFLAKLTYGKHEWVSATLGVVAATSIFWWVFGILPSAWIYYLDSSREILAGSIIPATMTIELPSGFVLNVANDLYNVIRDTVVVVQHLVAFVLVFYAAKKIQERLPKTLVAGEQRPEAGGYR